MNDADVREAAMLVDAAVERREQARMDLSAAVDEDARAAESLVAAQAALERAVRQAAIELGFVPPPLPCTAHVEPPPPIPRAAPPIVTLYVSESESDTSF